MDVSEEEGLIRKDRRIEEEDVQNKGYEDILIILEFFWKYA